MRWFGVSASTLTGVRATRSTPDASIFVPTRAGPPAPARRRTARPKVLARGGIYLAGGMKSWKDLMAVISSKRAALTASGKA